MRIRLLLCVVLLALLGGCSAPPAASPPVPPDGLAFRGSTVDGGAFDGAELAGTPVVLWFWAPF